MTIWYPARAIDSSIQESKSSYDYNKLYDSIGRKKYDRAESNFVTPLLQNEIENLEFILWHFKEPIWPRTISTRRTRNTQVLVFDEDEAYKKFQESDFVDCRINAYRDFTEYKGINRQPSDFIFIDIDFNNFGNTGTVEDALAITLKNIDSIFGGQPTILETGNGYHVYQPIESPILEQIELFSKFDEPSVGFLKFAEKKLSNNKSDPSHNPTFKSCLVRIPGSYNSKISGQKQVVIPSIPQVKIIQKWNGYRPPVNPLLYEFYLHLAAKRIEEFSVSRRTGKEKAIPVFSKIRWIDKLLVTPIPDYRKHSISLILAPYLINIRKNNIDHAYKIIESWLDTCKSLRNLDSDFKYRIRRALFDAKKKQIPPMKFETLKIKNNRLYKILNEHNKNIR